ncbi:DUF805 domain-containing protein [Tepidibacter sp. Z1-5]|uniref:DUF805 domain-containing protein n=1 Tax=Tepidibacter sp. Z1-5 TaxID=3134138 RepID=UPI0030C63321
MLKYFSFEGRFNRAKYFLYPFFTGIIFSIIEGLTFYIDNVFMWILLTVCAIAYTIFSVACTVKRLHDLGRPGTHFWLTLIPLYNIYLGLVLLFKKGDLEANEYGENPLLDVA